MRHLLQIPPQMRLQILQVGGVLLGSTIALCAPVLAKPAPPVVRASAYTKQVPMCYIELANSGFQSLDAACVMGKDLAGAGTIDMVTDRDRDGVPDALVPFFAQMDQFESLADATPQVRQAKIAQMQKTMNDFAARSPLSPALKADFKMMMSTLSDTALLTSGQPGNRPSERQMAQMNAKFASMEPAMRRLSSDPFMKQVEQYSSRYQQNKYEKMRAKLEAK